MIRNLNSRWRLCNGTKLLITELNRLRVWKSSTILGTTLKCQNFIHEEIKSRLNSGNACYHSVQRVEPRLSVFEKRVLRRIFGPKRDDVTGEWRRLHNEELYDLYCSSNTIREIKSIRIIWAGYVARMGRGAGHTGFWWGKPEGKNQLEE